MSISGSSREDSPLSRRDALGYLGGVAMSSFAFVTAVEAKVQGYVT